MKQYCLALDLQDDEQLIQQYENYHKQVPKEIRDSITGAGIQSMQIYRTGNRLFMIINTDDSFSFEKKAQMDADNKAVQKWEELMWQFQQALPWAKAGEKWILMNPIFSL